MGRIHATIQQGNSTPAKTRENFDELTSDRSRILSELTHQRIRECPTVLYILHRSSDSDSVQNRLSLVGYCCGLIASNSLAVKQNIQVK